MNKVLTVRELIAILLEFNMDARVKVNATGIPVDFDICWSSECVDDPKPGTDSRKVADDVIFDITVVDEIS